MKRSMLETPLISSSTIAFVLSNLTLTSFGLNSKTPPLYTSYPVTKTPPINALPTAPTAPAPLGNESTLTTSVVNPGFDTVASNDLFLGNFILQGVIEHEKPWLVLTVAPLGVLEKLTICSVPCCEVAQLKIKKRDDIKINFLIL